jgi:DNA invertase Pin-like site-specific DNA recombinase
MKPLLYLRTSTKEQNPELQRKSGIDFCIRIGLEEPEVFVEKGSAYNLEKIRPVWESVVEKAKKEKRDIVIWKYDRTFRNRPEFFKFMKVMFEVYGTKVYSVTEPSILSLWDMIGKSKTGNPIIDELIGGMLKIMWDYLIQMTGEQAEEESRRKSDRIQLAVRKSDSKPTMSYKGNKWGRKEISTQKKNKILELYKVSPKLSLREISRQVEVSLAVVHKLCQKYEREKVEDLVVQ